MGPFQVHGDTGPDVGGHRGGRPRGNSGTVQGSPWPGAGTKRLMASRHLPCLLAPGLHEASGKHQRQDTPQSVTWSHAQRPRCYFQNPPWHEDFEPPAVHARGQAHTRRRACTEGASPTGKVALGCVEQPRKSQLGQRERKPDAGGRSRDLRPRWHPGSRPSATLGMSDTEMPACEGRCWDWL